MKNQYKLITEKCYSSIINLDCLRINGFHFKPSNNIKYNGITVTKMTLVNYSFVEKVLKRKIKKRLEVYLRFIMTLVDDNDDTDITDLRAALNDLTRYKETIRYKYQKYLDKKYLSLLLKKIELLEHELKTKIYYYKEPDDLIVESHRRR